ncbi:hypothetical protein FKG94_09435 [Exilibacterium tricleocarpae]|uniref:DNA binding HTH domain-containing protein n=1 Tax=Exilibacterium tricleocarpae TaxID=2591008 RepID=A0A545TVR9_9GAMM|nr:helix-turn-helix domain-containing protein [Exilibacterium tricleocarpae]TQV81306.1 hypothetical protein FKG94_09435 [Exilibacterium tricleocarpae]
MSGWDGIIIYTLPSVSALAIKIIIFWMARHTLRSLSPWFLAFLIALCGINLIELITFAYVDRPYAAAGYLTLYYLFAVGACILLLGLSLEIGNYLNLFLSQVLLVLGFTCALVLIIPGAAVAGVESIGYSITRVSGPLYWVLQVTILATLASSLGVLWYSYRCNADPVRRRRAFVLLIATVPAVAIVLLVALLMQLGVKINGAVFVSFSMNFLLIVLLYTEKQARLFNFLSMIPATREYRTFKTISPLLFGHTPTPLKDAQAVFERELIRGAVERCGGNKTHAADMLGISRATLLRKLKSRPQTY